MIAEKQTELIEVVTGEIGGAICQICDARALHKFLQVGKNFPTWIKDRIETYGFIEGDEFSPISGKTSKGSKGGRPTIEYRLTLDMAKELAMVEKNERGKQIRRYFIECERQAANRVRNSRLPPDVEKACDFVSWKYSSQHQQQAMLLIGSARKGDDADLIWSISFLIKKRIYQNLTATALAHLNKNKHADWVTDLILRWTPATTSEALHVIHKNGG